MLSFIKGKRFEGEKHHADEIVFLIADIIIAIFSVIRCLFGIEITDEAFYVADAYSTYQGNLPFAYNTSTVAGMSLVTYPFVFIFRLFSSNNEGFFLYMRLCFVAFRFAIIFLIFLLLKKKYSKIALISSCALLVAWQAGFIGMANFSYNTSSFWLMVLSSVMISQSSAIENRNDKLLLFVAGGIAGFAVFAHPLQIIPVFLLCILLLFFSIKTKTKLQPFFLYACGGLTVFAVVMVIIASKAGIDGLFSGIDIMLFHQARWVHFNMKKRINEFVIWLMPLLVSLVICFIATMCVCKLVSDRLRYEWSFKYRWLLSSVFSIIPTIFIFWRGGSDSVCSYVGALSFWIIIMIFPITRDSLSYYLTLPFLAFFLGEVFFSSTGHAVHRVPFMFPVLFAMSVICLNEDLFVYNDNRRIISARVFKFVVETVVLLAAIFIIASHYLYVYRDSPVSNCDYKVAEGVFKGIYTTRERAEGIIALEKYIKDNTGENEWVSFRDNAPIGYLMSNGKTCDIMSWDSLQYTYVLIGDVEDNPTNMYRYYKNTGNIPDKYIYIDYGRDDIVSCDNPDFRFNDWLYKYYYLYDERRIDDQISVHLFKYNGKFDGNFDIWINDTIK